MSFHVLKKRDNDTLSSFWHADAENLPNIPDVSFVNQKLRDHVINVIGKAFVVLRDLTLMHTFPNPNCVGA